MAAKLWQGYRNYRRLGQITWVAFGALWSFFRETRKEGKGMFLAPTLKPLPEYAPSSPYRHIRQAMEKLGPTFIKLGQILSARPDLIPKELAQELSKLQDDVPPLSFEIVRGQFIKGLGSPPEDLFRSFHYQPLASASVAQVHKAVLPGGQTVAVKIQRPDLKKLAAQDLGIVKAHQKRFTQSFPGRLVEIPELIDDLSRQMERELDFTREALSMDAFRNILSSYEGIRVPAVYWSYTTKEILVMDYLTGVKAEELDEGARSRAARLLLQSLVAPIFHEGIFHADPHPGNMLFQRDGSLAWLDFGLVGRLDEGFRQRMSVLLIATAERDAAKVAELTLEWGRVVGPYSPSRLYEDLAELLDKISHITNGTMHLGHLILGMMDVSLAHHIKLPESFFFLGKTLLAGEGQARRLDPKANLMEIALPLAISHLREQMMPKLGQEGLYLQGLIYRDSLPNLYRRTGEILEKLSKGEQRIIFTHEGLEPLAHSIEKGVKFAAFSLILGALILALALEPNFQVGLTSLAPWIIAGAVGVAWFFCR